ncbi:MAG: PAS domain-containing protein [Anaerolineales bacterium]|nr:PAS domain-containing protein [Anaerolineales bacterium]MCB8983697.1 PAS domain-containing protein [Ardenticatenaceae bacterium]
MHANTSYIWLSILTAVSLLILALYSGRRRSVPGALPFAIGSLFAALWVVGIVLEAAAVDTAVQQFWFQFQRLWQFPATIAITGFILEYIWPGRWLTHRNILLFALLPFLFKELLLLNNFPPAIVDNLFLAYSYTLSFLVMAALFWLFFHTPQRHWPAAIMLIGQIGSRLAYALNLTQLLNTNLPINVIAIAFVFLMYAIALFGFHIFNPETLARQVAIDQMPTGMIALNLQGQITNLNPAARRLLGLTHTDPPAPALHQFLPLNAVNFRATNPDQVEVHLGRPATQRVCLLTASTLQDWRKRDIGYLLLLHDITEQKQAQTQLVAQQRALATLQERERLARELHDSLGQTLAATHLQASAARHLLAQGQLDQTDHCLAQLAEISIAAEADVRDYLLGAKTAFAPEMPFLETLRQYALRFGQQYNLQVELDTPPELETQSLGFPVEVQLLRLIQEALSNVRKHAAAHRVQIRFSVTDTLVEVIIEDDGRGFDPTLAQQTNRFGLQAMGERAAILGGTLDIRSRPDAGTQLTIRTPRQSIERPNEEVAT